MGKRYRERLAADRRLLILRLLDQTAGYSLNTSILIEALADWGHEVDRDTLHADCHYLAEQDLIDVEELGSIYRVTLTQRGADVAAGRARHPGVRRPGPED